MKKNIYLLLSLLLTCYISQIQSGRSSGGPTGHKNPINMAVRHDAATSEAIAAGKSKPTALTRIPVAGKPLSQGGLALKQQTTTAKTPPKKTAAKPAPKVAAPKIPTAPKKSSVVKKQKPKTNAKTSKNKPLSEQKRSELIVEKDQLLERKITAENSAAKMEGTTFQKEMKAIEQNVQNIDRRINEIDALLS